MIVIISPTKDRVEPPVLPWVACAPEDVFKYLVERGEDVVIFRDDANPSDLEAFFKKNLEKIERVYGLGHGSPVAYTVNHCKIFLSTTQNLNLVANCRVVHLLSCLTGQQLGRAIIQAGCEAYFGYSDFFYGTKVDGAEPCTCRYLLASLVGDVETEYAIHANIPYEDCYNAAIAAWNTEIAYWEMHYDEEEIPGVRPVTEEDAGMLIVALINNRDCFTMYTKVAPPGSPPLSSLFYTGMFLGGLGLTGFFVNEI